MKVLIEHYKAKEYWFIKYITWGVIGIVCFAILVHILKEVGFIPAQKVFDFLNQWAVALGAAVTLLLAMAAFLTIMDNRYARTVDRKERLLNEIIEWAFGIEKAATLRRKRERDELWDAKQKYLSSKAMSDYIKTVVSSCFNVLLNELEPVISQLEETIKATEEALSAQKPGSSKPNTDNLVPQEKVLRKQIVALTIEIARLKAKNVST